ncbi:MAG: GGDEF domain-containing protein [Rubrivivax sp.]
MSEVVDHLAELTGFRDRDVLDVTLVSALRDLLRPDSVAIYRPVGDNGRQHWLTRARLRARDDAQRRFGVGEIEDLPPLVSMPHHQICLEQQAAQTVVVEGQILSLFPLTTDRDTTGVLEVRTAATMTDEQSRLVSSILRVYRNFQGLLDYSERDTLTGLLNRKTFDGSFLRVVTPCGDLPERARAAVEERRRGSNATAWLGVVDIDHFKQVNDTHGHLIGDEVLLLVARLMRSSFRYQDQLYRFGGEEFVVLTRGGASEQARIAFERLRRNVETYVFPRVGRITVSVGFTQLRPGDSPSAAFERADKAVYHAKQNGRNQVADYGDLLTRGVFVEAARTGDMELF